MTLQPRVPSTYREEWTILIFICDLHNPTLPQNFWYSAKNVPGEYSSVEKYLLKLSAHFRVAGYMQTSDEKPDSS